MVFALSKLQSVRYSALHSATDFSWSIFSSNFLMTLFFLISMPQEVTVLNLSSRFDLRFFCGTVFPK